MKGKNEERKGETKEKERKVEHKKKGKNDRLFCVCVKTKQVCVWVLIQVKNGQVTFRQEEERRKNSEK